MYIGYCDVAVVPKPVVLRIPAKHQKKLGNSLPKGQENSVYLAAGVLPLWKSAAAVGVTAGVSGSQRHAVPCRVP